MKSMHPKERTAWAWLICLLLVPAAYFGLADRWYMAALPPDLMRLLPLSVALLSMALVFAEVVHYFLVLKSYRQGFHV